MANDNFSISDHLLGKYKQYLDLSLETACEISFEGTYACHRSIRDLYIEKAEENALSGDFRSASANYTRAFCFSEERGFKLLDEAIVWSEAADSGHDDLLKAKFYLLLSEGYWELYSNTSFYYGHDYEKRVQAAYGYFLEAADYCFDDACEMENEMALRDIETFKNVRPEPEPDHRKGVKHCRGKC